MDMLLYEQECPKLPISFFQGKKKKKEMSPTW